MSSQNPNQPCEICGAEGVCSHKSFMNQVPAVERPLLVHDEDFDFSDETRALVLKNQPASATPGYTPPFTNVINGRNLGTTGGLGNNLPPTNVTGYTNAPRPDATINNPQSLNAAFNNPFTGAMGYNAAPVNAMGNDPPYPNSLPPPPTNTMPPPASVPRTSNFIAKDHRCERCIKQKRKCSGPPRCILCAEMIKPQVCEFPRTPCHNAETLARYIDEGGELRLGSATWPPRSV